MNTPPPTAAVQPGWPFLFLPLEYEYPRRPLLQRMHPSRMMSSGFSDVLGSWSQR